MNRSWLTALLLAVSGMTAPANAGDFAFEFDWGPIPRCTSGDPGRVDNPRFTLSGVPPGTVTINFQMKDLNVPSFNHGGGKVKYAGEPVIQPGAFRYLSPCPPTGRHTYRWTAVAKDANGNELARATAQKDYP